MNRTDFAGTHCVLCEKPFFDGTQSRSSRTAVRVQTSLGRISGWACSPCVTVLANRQIGIKDPIKEASNPPFVSKGRFGELLEKYLDSDEYKVAKLTRKQKAAPKRRKRNWVVD